MAINLNNSFYIKIDENGDMESPALISADNMFYIMNSTWDFTEEEVRAKGFAPVADSVRDYCNGESNVDVTPGDIVKNDDGSFTQLWDEREIPLEEKRFRFMERTRHNLLFQTDWTQMPDSPLSDELKAQYAEYRQLLRDIPETIDWENITSSADIEWPLEPGVEVPDPGKPLPSED